MKISVPEKMLTWFVGLNVRILVSVIKFWELWGDVGAGDNLECDDVFFGGKCGEICIKCGGGVKLSLNLCENQKIILNFAIG